VNENILFFFSGTENSFDIALKMAEKMKSTDILNIASIKNMPPLKNYKRIGLVFPVYGFTMPNIVSRFIAQLPKDCNAYYFCIVTLGGVELGAMHRTFEAFAENGIGLDYITKIYMPENYILFSMVPGDNLIKTHLKNSIKRVEKAANEILNNKKAKTKRTIFYNFGKNISRNESKKWQVAAKNFVVGNNCIRCKKCIRVCPVGNIRMEGDNVIFDEYCECCLACIHLCPKEAINHGEKTMGKKRYINPNINIEEMKEYCP
jgi:ferredoxin